MPALFIKQEQTMDGVNITLGDNFSAFAAEVCRSTFKSSRFVKVKDYAEHSFRGPRGFHLRNLPKGYSLDVPSDGIGTKVGIITEALAHWTAGHDLIAMTASDITRWGGVPLVLSNVLDVSRLSEEGSKTYRHLGELISGLGAACRASKIVLMRGETAELGPYVGSENPDATTKFNWSSTMLGAYHPRRILDGNSIQAGDSVIALREDGFRSNGLSSVRAAFTSRFGAEWWSNPEAKEAIREAAKPSVLYDRFIAAMNGWHDRYFQPIVRIKAITHISGGGIPSKFGEDILFPRGLSAKLDGLYFPPPIMRSCFGWHPDMDEQKAYQVWNGGQGMLLVVAEKDALRFCKLAERHGIKAAVAGKIHDWEKPVLEIFSWYGSRWLTYKPKAS